MRLRYVWAILLAVVLVFSVTACSPADDEVDTADDMTQDTSSDDPTSDDEAKDQETTPPADDGETPFAWLVDVELTDAVTGETFRISDFRGEPVYIQGFAVW